MINPLDYSGKDQSEIKAEILHSSGHARLERGDQIGAASNQSFQQRAELTQAPRTIADYRRSALGGRFGALKAKPATPRTSHLKRSAAPTDGDAGATSRQAFNAGASVPERPPTGFKEPPSRGYNPYA